MSIGERAMQYGSLFGNWKIREFIGEGSQGKTGVFRMIKNCEGFREENALKVVTVIRADGWPEEMTDRARREFEADKAVLCAQAVNEVKLMSRLGRDSYVVFYHNWDFCDWEESGQFGCDLLIQMPMLKTLKRLQGTEECFSEEEIRRVGQDICRALIRCGEEDIIHRDIKPANIFIWPDRKGNYMLGDFGVSRIVENGLRGDYTSIGTKCYAAPEQFAALGQSGARYDSRVDIYSLGLTLYELAHQNRLPFQKLGRGSSEEIINQRLSGSELPPPSQASHALASVILKACAFRPEDRFQTAEEFLDALEGIRNGRIAELSVSDVKSELELDPYATMPLASFVQEDSLTAQKAGDVPISKPKATHLPQSQPVQKQNPQSMSKVRPVSMSGMKIEDGVLVKYDGPGGDVIIPEGVTAIGDDAFIRCKSLTNVVIPEGVTTIGADALSWCKSLTSVTIPDGVTTIGDGAFRGCKSLTSVTIPEGVTAIGWYTFVFCERLTKITIPEGVTTIGEGAFSGCKSLTSVTIPESVTTIGGGAFNDCESLESITIPKGVTTIGRHTFDGCQNLTCVTIPKNVTMIDKDAFGLCHNPSLTIHTPAQSYAHEYAKEHNIKVQSIAQEVSMPCMEIEDAVEVQTDILRGETCFGKEQARSLFTDDMLHDIRWAASKSFDEREKVCRRIHLTIPQGYTVIESDAFVGILSDTIRIGRLILPDTILEIRKKAFDGLEILDFIEVPDSVQVIKNLPRLGTYAYVKCSKNSSARRFFSKDRYHAQVTLTKPSAMALLDACDGCDLIVPEGYGKIESHAFWDYSRGSSEEWEERKTKVKRVIIPDTMNYIQDLDGLEITDYIWVPASVKHIGEDAFNHVLMGGAYVKCDRGTYVYGTCKRRGIPTSPEQARTFGQKQVKKLFSKAVMSEEVDLLIPEGYTTLDSGAFSEIAKLTDKTGKSPMLIADRVILPKTMGIIREKAFDGLIISDFIEIPDSVCVIDDFPYLGPDAYVKCESGSDVHTYCRKYHIKNSVDDGI